jgi:hypothetical protein
MNSTKSNPKAKIVRINTVKVKSNLCAGGISSWNHNRKLA